MNEITLDYYDEELIKDFLGELTDAQEAIEQTYDELVRRPGAPALLDELFRTLHSVKSNLRMMGLNRYSDLVHAFENILDQTRRVEIGYEPLMADMFLLSMLEVRRLCEAHFAGGEIDEERCQRLERPLGRIAFASREGIEEAVKVVIRLLDPGYLDEESPAPAPAVPAQPAPAPSAPAENDPAPNPAPDPALERFAAMAHKAEERLPGWSGRTARVVALARALNEAAGEPVPPRQLAAAGWMHVIGLCRLPADRLDRLDEPEARGEPAVAAYPAFGAALLRKEPGWEAAAEMVEQHREWWSGEGYPQGLVGDAITPGARLLSLAAAFEALPAESLDDRREVLRAVTAINAQAGRRFDGEWVKRLNQVIRQRYVGSE